MKRILATVLCLALAACNSVPQIVITPDTGNGASATVPTPNPGTGIGAAVGNLFAQDDAGALSLACAGKPPADPIGCNFLTDLANLSNALAAQQGTAAPTQAGLLVLVERARLAIGSINDLGNNALLQKTYADGSLYVLDTKRRGLAVPGQVITLLIAINSQLMVP